MQKLNLVHKEKSDIDYSISRFPDGEVQIMLGEVDRKDYVSVRCRITNAEDLFILMQVMDILERQEVEYNLLIHYLMGMRMDRVMDFNRPFTLKIVGNILHKCRANEIAFLELHSDKIEYLYPDDRRLYMSPGIQVKNLNINFDDYQLVAPDHGAWERYTHEKFYDKDVPIICCKKVRDVKTGKILSIEVENPKSLDGRPLLIVDDLCDAGGTFLGVAKALRKYTDVPLNIYVVHMVNPKGIENLSKTYDHVWFTNSYKDWENLPENVTQITVI